nr:hypothetical protein [Tanacetum cinerariifolium]
MVDFVEASPLRYALTFKPTVYVSHIRQFWSTARIETTDEGTKILAAVDGIHITITESSLRRNLNLQDEEGISSLPDLELFENLTLMGYNISPNQKFTFQKDQDRETIAKSSTLPYDSAPRVTSPAAVEEDREGLVGERSRDDAPIKGRNLDEGEAAAERVSDDSKEMATVLTSIDASTILASGVTEVPTGIFATATVVTPYRRRKGKEVMVESKTPKKQKVQEQIDAQVARELEEQLVREDQRMSKQIARDAKVTRIHVKEELQSMIDGLDRSNETVAKYLQEYQQFALELPLERRIKLISDLVRSNLGWKVKDFRGMTFKEIEAKFTSVWKQIKDFIPMGSKEEAERLKRKGLSLEQESAKKLKTSAKVSDEVKSHDEVPKEKVKEMMQLVPIEEVYVEALQVKHSIIDRKVYTDGQRSYWKIIRLGGSSASYQFFVDLLKHMDREVLNQLWALVKESLSNRCNTPKLGHSRILSPRHVTS